METETEKLQISEAIIDLFVSIIGFIPRDSVTLKTNFVYDFEIIDDDLTCFMMQVKWQYNIKVDQAKWNGIETIEEVVDWVIQNRRR